MANTRFGYVRQYELPDSLLPGTFLVVRIDGKGFHGFADRYGFEKPNDRRALDLMNAAAMRTITSETLRQHVVLAFGESDEYSFLISSASNLFSRRSRSVPANKALNPGSRSFNASARLFLPLSQSSPHRTASCGLDTFQIHPSMPVPRAQALTDGKDKFKASYAADIELCQLAELLYTPRSAKS